MVLWYCMVLFCVVWCRLLLFGFVWCCMVLFVVVWYCKVLYGVVLCCMVSFVVVWYCMVLYGVVLHSIVMVEVPAISYFPIPTDGKGVLVWFHFLLAAGKLLTGNL